MYIQIDRDSKIEKLVGSVYINIVGDETAELYILLGRTEVGTWVSYRIDAVKIYTTNENYHTKSFVDDASLINAYNLFTQKILFGQINVVDIKLNQTFSSTKCKTPMTFQKLEPDVLSNWYMKNMLLARDLPNVIFSEKTQKDSLQKIKKTDLEIGRLYVSKGNKVYTYIGYIDNQYMFALLNHVEEDSTEYVVDYKGIKGTTLSINKTKSLPLLFVLDNYPVHLLSKDLQSTRTKWYKKKYTFSYKSCLEFKILNDNYRKPFYMDANPNKIREIDKGVFTTYNLPYEVYRYFNVVEEKTSLPMTITLLPENKLLKKVYLELKLKYHFLCV